MRPTRLEYGPYAKENDSVPIRIIADEHNGFFAIEKGNSRIEFNLSDLEWFYDVLNHILDWNLGPE